MERLLVTGAAGLIGTILLHDLRNGFEVTAVDHRPGDGIQTLDLADEGAVFELFERGRFDKVLHLAADSDVEASWSSLLRNNVAAAVHVFEASAANGAARVVFASSNHVTGGYGPEAGVLTAAAPPLPDSPYGLSKLFGEELARYYHRVRSLSTICLRIGSVRPDDAPRGSPRFESTWLSHRDLRVLVRAALDAPVSFGVYYGVSANRKRVWSIEAAVAELGYDPEDDATRWLEQHGRGE